jgi:hypothetical protein
MALSLQVDYLAMYSMDKEEEGDVVCETWVEYCKKEVKKNSIGSLIGDIDIQTRNTKVCGDEQGKRLVQKCQKWSPNVAIYGYLDAGDNSGADSPDNKLDKA